ncbi:MAG TPA: condensation domain-containing protein, partial [Pyrinomonadaceae bacterium]|nr:condensation domain-containing protein [Pyrinomonadaceae bacterium]
MQEHIEGFRLSKGQARLWPRQHKHTPAYRAQAAILVEGEVEADRLREAVRRTVARHEILRTTFQSIPGVSIPLQVIDERARFDWEEATHSIDDAGGRDVAVDKLLRQEGQRKFDLERGPVARFLLAQLSNETHVLFASLPALCADFTTLKSLTREIAEAYDDIASARGAREDDEPTQFVQFSEWQHELNEEGEADEAAVEFWRRQRQLRRESLATSPYSARADADAASEPERVTRTMSAENATRLRETAARHDSTPEAWLLACWQSLLWRQSGEPGLVVDVWSDGRKFEELAGALGLISEFLPVDGRFDSKTTTAECASRAGENLRRARKRQEYYAAAGGTREGDEEDVASAVA